MIFILQHNSDRNKCIEVLSAEMERIKILEEPVITTKTGRRYSLQDHLSNQMEKRMELEGELRLGRAALNRVRLEVQDLEDMLRRKELP